MPELLDELAARDDVLLALVTGNFEPIARLKLARAGIGDYFPRGQGGFGSDHEDRAALPPIARAAPPAAGRTAPARAHGGHRRHAARHRLRARRRRALPRRGHRALPGGGFAGRRRGGGRRGGASRTAREDSSEWSLP